MIKSIVLAAISVQFFWDHFLQVLNVRFIKKNTECIPGVLPGVLRSRISQEDYIKASDYTEAKVKFGVATGVFNLVLVFAAIIFSLFEYVDSLVEGFPAYRVAFCLVVFFIVQLMGIPVKIYSVFVIEEKFGFNKMTPATFVMDVIKSLILSVLIMAPLLWLLFYFYDVAGSYWWFYGFILFSLIQLIMLILYPLVIAPLFNKFTPLEQGELFDGIKELASKVRFSLRGVYVMDGSKRSSHSNAYFTGIGKTKRIVLFDTLMERLSVGELLAVLAHELGHYKLHHVKINLVISMGASFLGFYILDLFIKSKAFFNSMGYSEPSVHIGLVLLMIILPVVDMLFGPLSNMLSRKHEYAADEFAVKAISDGKENLPKALVKLNKENLSSPLTHPLYSFINYSHPPLIERLGAIENL